MKKHSIFYKNILIFLSKNRYLNHGAHSASHTHVTVTGPDVTVLCDGANFLPVLLLPGSSDLGAGAASEVISQSRTTALTSHAHHFTSLSPVFSYVKRGLIHVSRSSIFMTTGEKSKESSYYTTSTQ